MSLLTLLVAIAGAGTAIVLTETTTKNAGDTFSTTPATTPLTSPSTVPATTAPGNTSTLPTAPEPTTTTPRAKPGPPNGRLSWPANENGWTIVLVSYPKTNGRPAARETAARAAKSGLLRVGILDSSLYASLQPGYLVVFTGIYGSKD